jgi:hypothetical protein
MRSSPVSQPGCPGPDGGPGGAFGEGRRRDSPSRRYPFRDTAGARGTHRPAKAPESGIGTMNNRIWPPNGGIDEARPAPNFWVVCGEFGVYYLSEEAARTLLGKLTRWWVPRWVSFTVLGGTRVRLRSRAIESVEESTRELRAWTRKFHSALNSEAEDDPPAWTPGPW